MKKKAQISTEFLIIISIVTLIFVITLAFTSKISIDTDNLKQETEKMSECIMLSNVFSSISIAGEGALFSSHTLYNITVDSDDSITVEEPDVDKEDSSVSCFSLISVKSGEFNGDYVVKNINNTVHLFDNVSLVS